MVFLSTVFLSAFLPLTLGLCWLARRRVAVQNGLLLLLSLFFYAWGEIRYVPLMALSALGNALLGRWACEKRERRWPLWTAVGMNIGLLLYFKYASFFARSVLGLDWGGPALPLGISFFTFQGLSYVIDMRRGRETPGTVLEGCLYIGLFPQLVAGPIVRWGEIQSDMRHRRVSLSDVADGLHFFIPGLAKKVLLADTLGRLADAAFACPDQRRWAPFALLGGVAFCLQLFLDFSGYSDMALGLGRMLGFHFPKNFDAPFRAASLRDFWRRWHITLSRWFRDYVYIPLGGSRRGRGRTLLNLLLVFALTGLWHGAGWTFLLWGLWNGLWVIAERAGWIRPDTWPRPLAHGYTLAVVLLGFMLFRADSLAAAAGYFASLFTQFSPIPSGVSTLRLALTPDVLLALAGAVFVSMGVRLRLPEGARCACHIALLILCILSIVSSGYHPFLYFRF